MSATHQPLALACICAWCGRWRDDAGVWRDLPARPPAGRRITHGICRECETAWRSSAAEETLPN